VAVVQQHSHETSATSAWASLATQRFISLETYRKDGTAVRTPVGFVIDGGGLIIRTLAHSGKVKRLQRNPQVRFAPSTGSGALLGEWSAASAMLVDAADGERTRRLIVARYGLLWRVLEIANRVQSQLKGTRSAWVSIRLMPR
jgi:uncharacterized protein